MRTYKLTVIPRCSAEEEQVGETFPAPDPIAAEHKGKERAKSVARPDRPQVFTLYERQEHGFKEITAFLA